MGATKIPSECLWHERWPVWGYVGAEFAQSGFQLGILYRCVINITTKVLLYPQTKVGNILDSGPSRRCRRRRRNFLVDAITQKQINIFFSNLVHMLRVPKGRSLF